MLGLCLVATLALGAYATSSAMAGPQWVQCKSASELEALGYPFEAKQVKYVDANCTSTQPKEARAYVRLKAPEVENLRVNYLHKATANVPFSGGSVEGGGVLTATDRECNKEGKGYRTTRQGCEEVGGTEYLPELTLPVECATETNTGETESKNKVANVKVLFTGCAALGIFACNSAGLEEGEIETNTLKGSLGYINKANKEVGVLLEPAEHHGSFTAFDCSGIIRAVVGVGNKTEGTEYVQGEQYPEGCFESCPGATPNEEKHGGWDGIISPITPVNTMTTEFTQVYGQEAEYPYKNIPSHFENKHIDALEVALTNDSEEFPGMWSAAGEEVTNVNTSEEAGEIKA